MPDMLEGWQERTLQRLLQYLDQPVRVAVVGNGPLSLRDRASIARARKVFRFNDVNNFWDGENTTIHVVRHPSRSTTKMAGVPEWHVKLERRSRALRNSSGRPR